MRCNANVGGALLTHIFIRKDVRKIEVWEEFLHGTQKRCGLIDKLGVAAAEVHVKKFMVRHRQLLGISGADVQIILSMLQG
jgi:hypothetical protein